MTARVGMKVVRPVQDRERWKPVMRVTRSEILAGEGMKVSATPKFWPGW
jgi:hypothetical protein